MVGNESNNESQSIYIINDMIINKPELVIPYLKNKE